MLLFLYSREEGSQLRQKDPVKKKHCYVQSQDQNRDHSQVARAQSDLHAEDVLTHTDPCIQTHTDTEHAHRFPPPRNQVIKGKDLHVGTS